jgi:hypothetical protein
MVEVGYASTLPALSNFFWDKDVFGHFPVEKMHCVWLGVAKFMLKGLAKALKAIPLGKDRFVVSSKKLYGEVRALRLTGMLKDNLLDLLASGTSLYARDYQALAPYVLILMNQEADLTFSRKVLAAARVLAFISNLERRFWPTDPNNPIWGEWKNYGKEAWKKFKETLAVGRVQKQSTRKKDAKGAAEHEKSLKPHHLFEHCLDVYRVLGPNAGVQSLEATFFLAKQCTTNMHGIAGQVIRKMELFNQAHIFMAEAPSELSDIVDSGDYDSRRAFGPEAAGGIGVKWVMVGTEGDQRKIAARGRYYGHERRDFVQLENNKYMEVVKIHRLVDERRVLLEGYILKGKTFGATPDMFQLNMPLLVKRHNAVLEKVDVAREDVHEVVVVPVLRNPDPTEREKLHLQQGDSLLYHNIQITHGEFRIWDEDRLSPSLNYPLE